MNLNVIKKQVRLAFERSACANKWAAMVPERKKRLIDHTARRIKEEGITIEQATSFAQSEATMIAELHKHREVDYPYMAKRRQQMKGKYKQHKRAGLSKDGTVYVSF